MSGYPRDNEQKPTRQNNPPGLRSSYSAYPTSTPFLNHGTLANAFTCASFPQTDLLHSKVFSSSARAHAYLPSTAVQMKQVAMVSSSPMLLRGKSLNRSRRRSRSRAGRRSTMQEGGGGEPSSPKVTCIGQIRSRSRSGNTESKPIDLCQCLKRAFVCRTKKSCRFFSCWNKKIVEEKPSQPEAKTEFLEAGTRSDDGDRKKGDYEESNKLIPPNNALILMRCRSAPHNRSSALSLSRFPISPVPASESNADQDETIGRASDCNVSLTVNKEEEEEEEEICSPLNLEVPTGLMRCKSEPAKRAEKMMEVSSCKLSVSEERGMQMYLPFSSETRHVSSS